MACSRNRNLFIFPHITEQVPIEFERLCSQGSFEDKALGDPAASLIVFGSVRPKIVFTTKTDTDFQFLFQFWPKPKLL